MKTIDDVLKLNKQSGYSFTAAAPIWNTIQMIDRKESGALLFIEAGNLVVMVSEGDSPQKVVLDRKSINETQLRNILTRTLIYPANVESDEEDKNPAQVPGFRYLPIMLEGFLIGEISKEDFTRIVLS